jgi:hypothetical protein
MTKVKKNIQIVKVISPSIMFVLPKILMYIYIFVTEVGE